MIWTGWTLLGGFLRSRIGLGLIAALVLAGLAWWAYSTVWQRGYDVAATEGATALRSLQAEMEAGRRQAEREARVAEAAERAKYDAIAKKYEEDRNYAQIQYDDDVASLRNGSIRLRTEWAGCETDLLSRTAESAARADDLARLRAEGAANLVRLGAECDAQIRGLQGALRP